MSVLFIACGVFFMLVPIGYLLYLSVKNRTSISRIAALFGIVFILGGFIVMMIGVGQLLNQSNENYQRKCAARGGTIQHDYCYKPGSEIHIP